MPRKKIVNQNGEPTHSIKHAGNVSLKQLAAHLNLSPTAVSMVLNDAPSAVSIPPETKERILAAARELNYRPNFLARSLRAQRTFTLGVLVPELSDGYSAMVLSGIEDFLIQENYFYLAVSHRHDAKLLTQYKRLLYERQIEGLIAVDTPCDELSLLPVVAVSGHSTTDGVTNVALDHTEAARLALEHLRKLGHSDIAFIKGQNFSSDTEVRWQAIEQTAAGLSLKINRHLVTQLEGNSPSPELGFTAMQKILARKRKFTAVFAFNDVSAVGAIRALHDAGQTVPRDVSVVGFDDVDSAAFHNPPLTTVRQPLREMGKLAAETLLQRLNKQQDYPRLVTVKPELIIRASTAANSAA